MLTKQRIQEIIDHKETCEFCPDEGLTDTCHKCTKVIPITARELREFWQAMRNAIPLPVSIGGMIYVPYRLHDLDDTVDEGVEGGKLTGYVNEPTGNGPFYTYVAEGGGTGDIEVDLAFVTPEAAQIRLAEMAANGEFTDGYPVEPGTLGGEPRCRI